MDAMLALSRLADIASSASRSRRLFPFVIPISDGLHRLKPELRTLPGIF